MSHGICENVLNMKKEAVQKEFKRCIECGACYISCPFDLWGGTNQERRQTVKDANDFIYGRKPVTDFLKSEIFRCAECDHCHRTCPTGIHRKNSNLLVKLKVQPKNVAKLRSHPAQLRGTKQFFFETLNVKKWSSPEQNWYNSLNEKREADVLVYAGCYVASTREDCMKLESLLSSAQVDFVTFGKFEYCCGNFGLYRGVSDLCETTPKIVEMIKTVNPKKIITNCGHCKEAVENSLKMTGRTDIRVLHPADELLELVLQKKLVLKPLNMTATIQDSCLSGQSGSNSSVRNLLSRVAVISENRDSQQRSKCCGDVPHVADPKGIHHYNESRKREFIETNADHLAVYCAGCKDIYSAFKELKTRDVIDIVYEAWKGTDYVR